MYFEKLINLKLTLRIIKTQQFSNFYFYRFLNDNTTY